MILPSASTIVEHFYSLKMSATVFQALSGDFQHTCGKMHVQILLGVRWCAMSIFLFLIFCNFIKGIMHIVVFLKNLRPMFLYFTY